MGTVDIRTSTMSVTINNQLLNMLAQRFPLVVQDLNRSLAASQGGLGALQPEGPFVIMRHGSFEYLFNSHSPAPPACRLKELPQDVHLVQVFCDAAAMLAFLSDPQSQMLIRFARWHPLLLIPKGQSVAIADWLQKHHPREWPWSAVQGAVSSGAAHALIPELAGDMRTGLQSRIETIVRQVNDRYTDWPTVQELLASKTRPVRALVLGAIDSAYQRHSARDITQAFEGTGIDARLKLVETGFTALLDMYETLLEFAPDVIIEMGKGRKGIRHLPDNVTVVSWDQDYDLTSQEIVAEQLGTRDRIMVMVKEWEDQGVRAGVPTDQIFHVNLGTNLNVYRPAVEAPSQDYDVVFVGNIHPFEQYKSVIGFDQLWRTTQRILLNAKVRLRDWVLSRSEDERFVIPDCDQLLRDVVKEQNVGYSGTENDWEQLVLLFRYRVAHMELRELYARALTDFNIAFFGNGWDSFPDLAAYAHPPVENGPQLLDLIHRSKINIHLHTWTVHHPRLYDTAAAGGFLLVGRVPEMHGLEQVFDVGGELDSFGSIPQMKAQIAHYLDQPGKRHEMGQRAAIRAENDHQMSNRMQQLIRRLEHDPVGRQTAA